MHRTLCTPLAIEYKTWTSSSSSQTETAEEIKAFLAAFNPSIYSLRVPEKYPDAEYRVLWCSLASPSPSAAPANECEIQICLPGTIDTLLLSTLLHKTIAWSVHRQREQRKQANDVEGLHAIITARAGGVDTILEEDEEGGGWYLEWFFKRAFECVGEFEEDVEDAFKAVEDGLREAKAYV
ncbi:hypothetical protein GGX14DRAFT_567272 [Mycena pura]|uniref:Uncharacterized protein n=1 Tax=Mycena pura TaxID=153505 RepID=A0AAD6VF42_9AGAR|nr:hypothetical protein GGX14DRAFT_567272 [Mycena pura]